MLDSQIKPKSSEQRMLYELNGATLTVYSLSIDKDYRFRKMTPFINPDYDAFYAQAIQGRWPIKPLEDLLDKNNKSAKTTVSSIKLRSMGKKYIKGDCSSFKLFRRWKEPGYNLSSPAKYEIGAEKFKDLEMEGIETFLNGENTYQPIRIVDNSKTSNGNKSIILLPTSNYSNQVIKGRPGKKIEIMPAIIKIPTNLYLSHLVDIEDYDRFLQDEYVRDDERIDSFGGYTLISREEFPLESFSLDEQGKIKEKAKRDRRIIGIFKRSKNIN